MSTLAPLFLAKHPDGEERQVIRPNVWETSCADTETLSIFHIEGMADPDLLCRCSTCSPCNPSPRSGSRRPRGPQDPPAADLPRPQPAPRQRDRGEVALAGHRARRPPGVLSPCRQGPPQRQRAAAGQRRLSPVGARGGRPVHSASSAGLLALAGRPAHGYSAGSPGSQKTAMCSPDPAERAHVPTAFPSG